MIKLKRVYEPPSPNDGLRVLIDRLWPRGLSKEKARIELWLKDAAPSAALRESFGHDPAKWGDFQKKYGRELEGRRDMIERIKSLEKDHKVVTLVYGAKDEEHNNAIVLRSHLLRRSPKRRRRAPPAVRRPRGR